MRVVCTKQLILRATDSDEEIYFQHS